RHPWAYEQLDIAGAFECLGLGPWIRDDIAFTNRNQDGYADRRCFERHRAGSDHIDTAGGRGCRTPWRQRIEQPGRSLHIERHPVGWLVIPVERPLEWMLAFARSFLKRLGIA